MKIDDSEEFGQVKISKKDAILAGLVFFVIALIVGGLLYASFFKEKEPEMLDQKVVSEELDLKKETATSESLNIDNGNADDDGDGLKNWEEIKYKTDKDSKDSDGDGYSDFQEINSGFNPLGDGELDAQMLAVKKSIKENREVFEKIEALKNKADSNQTIGYEKNKIEEIYSIFKKFFSINGFIALVIYLFFAVIFLAFYAFIFNLICGRIFGIIEANTETSFKIVAINAAVIFLFNIFIKIINFFAPSTVLLLLGLLGGIVLGFVTLNKLLTKYYQTTLGQNIKIIITTHVIMFVMVAAFYLLILFIFFASFGALGGLRLM